MRVRNDWNSAYSLSRTGPSRDSPLNRHIVTVDSNSVATTQARASESAALNGRPSASVPVMRAWRRLSRAASRCRTRMSGSTMRCALSTVLRSRRHGCATKVELVISAAPICGCAASRTMARVATSPQRVCRVSSWSMDPGAASLIDVPFLSVSVPRPVPRPVPRSVSVWRRTGGGAAGRSPGTPRSARHGSRATAPGGKTHSAYATCQSMRLEMRCSPEVRMTRSTSGMSGWGRRRAKLSSVTCSGGTPSRISDLAASTMSRRPPWSNATVNVIRRLSRVSAMRSAMSLASAGGIRGSAAPRNRQRIPRVCSDRACLRTARRTSRSRTSTSVAGRRQFSVENA